MIGQPHGERVTTSLDHRRGYLHRLLNDRAEVEVRLVQAEFASSDAAHVQQIIDKRRQLHRLAENRVAQPLQWRIRGSLGLKQLHSRDDRRQWAPQLVCQDREKLVLAAIAFPPRLTGPASL